MARWCRCRCSRTASFSACLGVAIGMTFGMYAMLFLTPLYLQSARGNSALIAGLELLPMSVTFAIVSQLSGKIANAFGPRLPMTAGMAMMGAGLFMLALIPLNDSLYPDRSRPAHHRLRPRPQYRAGQCGRGRQRPGGAIGTASGLVNTARMVGATLGVAVLGAVFAMFAGGTRREQPRRCRARAGLYRRRHRRNDRSRGGIHVHPPWLAASGQGQDQALTERRRHLAAEGCERYRSRFLGLSPYPLLFTSRLVAIFNLPLALVTGWLLWRSRDWPLAGDATIFHFIAGQMQMGAVPYRDIIDVNMPLTYAIHAAVVAIGGMSDIAWRAFDLTATAVLAALILMLLAPVGRAAAVLAVLVVLLMHLLLGPYAAGQRDFLMSIPRRRRCFAVGACGRRLSPPLSLSAAGRRPRHGRRMHQAYGDAAPAAACIGTEATRARDPVGHSRGCRRRACRIRYVGGAGRIGRIRHDAPRAPARLCLHGRGHNSGDPQQRYNGSAPSRAWRWPPP